MSMSEALARVTLFEVAEEKFNRHDRGILIGMGLFWGITGPAILLVLGPLFLGTVIEPGVVYLALVIVLVAASLYLLALRYNRFGVYDTGIALTKRPISVGVRLRGAQYVTLYADIVEARQSGRWSDMVRPEEQPWYFTLVLRDGQKWILPAIGVWEAVSPALREAKPEHARELKQAYDALAWVAGELNRPENRLRVQRGETVRLSVANFERSHSKTTMAGGTAAG